MGYAIEDYEVVLQQRIACYVNGDKMSALDKKLVKMLVFGSTCLVNSNVSMELLTQLNIVFPERLQQQCLFVQHLTKIAGEKKSPENLYRQLTDSNGNDRLLLSLATRVVKKLIRHLNSTS